MSGQDGNARSRPTARHSGNDPEATAPRGNAWVQKELELAMNREIDSSEVVVLPLLIENCELPEFIKGKYYADFSRTGNYENELHKLLQRIQKNYSKL